MRVAPRPGTAPYRPDLPKLVDSDVDATILELVRSCWEEEPGSRPALPDVLRFIKRVNKGRCVRACACVCV